MLAQRPLLAQIALAMSDESNSKNVASIWILVVLLGGMSVPFWRWDSSSRDSELPVEWVDKQQDTNLSVRSEPGTSNPISGNENSIPSHLLQEFSSADPSLMIQDAVKNGQNRPGIAKEFQSVGIPLTEIKPWLPRSNTFDASPANPERLVGAGEVPLRNQGGSESSPTLTTKQNASLVGSVEPLTWPDIGYKKTAAPITPPAMQSNPTFFPASPRGTSDVNSLVSSPATSADSNAAAPTGSASVNSPGRMVSSPHVTDSDPPTLSLDQLPPPPSQTSAANNPAQPPPTPLVPSSSNTEIPQNSLREPNRRPGTLIRQPKRGS